jgi:hypothetical protein
MNTSVSILAQTTLKLACVAAIALAGTVGIALAGPIPYPNTGTVNPTTYSFTATATGDVIGYFGGSGASFDEQVGLLVNGVLTANGYGLDDHSTAVGDSFDFGPVTAGDTLVFVDRINGNGFVYSDPSLNGPYDAPGTVNDNHIYSTNATANQVFAGSVAGTYIGFEDLPFPGSDFNYFDDTFVFTDVSTTTNGVPDGAPTLSLLGAGLAALLVLRRRVDRVGAV